MKARGQRARQATPPVEPVQILDAPVVAVSAAQASVPVSYAGLRWDDDEPEERDEDDL